MTVKRQYTYFPKIDKDDEVFWHVHESATDQIVKKTFFEDDAIDVAEFFENGGGFAGFTPSFMVREVNVPLPINEAFVLEFTE